MGRLANGPGPGAFDEAQAKAYAAAVDIETEFPHDQVFLDLLRHYARGAGLDLGGGTGRYAAWLLETGLATSVHVIDHSPPMIDGCMGRRLPGLTARVGDVETADLGREYYDLALARFVLMHTRDLEGTVNRIATSLKEAGALIVVTNIVHGTPTGLTTFLEETSGIMQLILRVQGKPIPVANYARTHADYTNAFQEAGLSIAFSQTYEPRILRFEKEHPGVTLSHLVLLGKKYGHT
jgi:SAM-dependent methyltransferase